MAPIGQVDYVSFVPGTADCSISRVRGSLHGWQRQPSTAGSTPACPRPATRTIFAPHLGHRGAYLAAFTTSSSTKRHANLVAAAPHHLAVSFLGGPVANQEIEEFGYAHRRHHLQAGALVREVAYRAVDDGGAAERDLRGLQNALPSSGAPIRAGGWEHVPQVTPNLLTAR
jgi:hypothetical protein